MNHNFGPGSTLQSNVAFPVETPYNVQQRAYLPPALRRPQVSPIAVQDLSRPPPMTHTVIEMPQEEPTPVARVNVQRTWAFPGFWKSKSTEEEPTATRAHMGESNNGQAYYDENLKQWVWTNDQNNGTSQSQVPQHWSPPPTRPPPGPPANGSYPQHTYPIHNRYAAYGMNTY